ncbi:myosin-kinesin ATPase superfamily-like protein [Aureococcus anophagefferens]|nr:myosin-kinesin ATPase superfamily-like protein [Aureococcus anophagefferens]
MEAPAGEAKTIGVLDIFGFEIFESNSFEQLCINLTNEQLQNKFNRDIFELELRLYADEGVPCDGVEYKDNSDVIALLGDVLAMLDEEARLPGLREELEQQARAGEAFGVVHYAGLVTYDVDQFLVKNVDQLSGDLSSCVAGSSHERTAALLTWNDAPAAAAPRARGGRGSGGGSKTTVSKKFRGQLASLTTALNATEPHYVRCVKPGAGRGAKGASLGRVKPNMEKVKRVFRSPVVLEQLTYAGVFETVTIQQSGWPFRSPHERFATRYFVLDLKNAAALRRLGPSGHARALLAGLRASDDRCFGEAQVAFGKTVVFYRATAARARGAAAEIRELRPAVAEAHAVAAASVAFLHGFLPGAFEAALERGDAVLKALEEGERLAGILEALVAKDDAAAHYDDLERALKAVDAVADPDATRGGRLSAAAEAARAQVRGVRDLMVAKRCLERGVAERSKADLEEGLGPSRGSARPRVSADFCAAEERAAEACKDAVFAEVAAVVPPIRKRRARAPAPSRWTAARSTRPRCGPRSRARSALGGAATAAESARWLAIGDALADAREGILERRGYGTMGAVDALERALATGGGGDDAALGARGAALRREDDAAADEIARASPPAPSRAPRTYEAASPGVRAAGVARRRYDACASVARLRASIAAGDFGGARDHLDAASAAAAATRREGVVREHTRWTAVRVAVKAVSAFRAPIRRSPAAPAKQASWLDAAEAELDAWRRVLDDEDRKRGLAAAMAAGAAHLSGAVGDRTADPARLAAALAALDGGREAPSLATVALATAARPLADARAALAKGDYDALEDAGLHFDAVVVAREAGVHGDGGGDGVVDMAVLGARAEMDCLRVEVLNVRAREACEAVAATPRVVGVPGAVDGSRLDPVAERAALAVAGKKVSAVTGGASRDVEDAYELAVALGDLRAKAHADDWDAILTKGVLDVDSAEVALLRDEASDRRDRAAALAALAEGRPRGAVGSLDVGAVDDAPLRALDGGRRSPATVQLYEIVLEVAGFRATLKAGDVDLDEAALRQAAAACDVLAESERVKIHADRLRVGPRFDAALAAAVVAGPALGAPGALDLATCTTGAIADARASYAGLDATCGALDAAVRVAAALADLRTRAKEDVPWDLEATVARVAAVADAVAAFGRASDATGGADWAGALAPGALAPVVEEAHLVEVEAHDRIISRDVPRLAAAGRVAGAPETSTSRTAAEGCGPRWTTRGAGRRPARRRRRGGASRRPRRSSTRGARRSPAAGPTSRRPSTAGDDAIDDAAVELALCLDEANDRAILEATGAALRARPATGDAGALVAGDPRRSKRPRRSRRAAAPRAPGRGATSGRRTPSSPRATRSRRGRWTRRRSPLMSWRPRADAPDDARELDLLLANAAARAAASALRRAIVDGRATARRAISKSTRPVTARAAAVSAAEALGARSRTRHVVALERDARAALLMRRALASFEAEAPAGAAGGCRAAFSRVERAALDAGRRPRATPRRSRGDRQRARGGRAGVRRRRRRRRRRAGAFRATLAAEVDLVELELEERRVSARAARRELRARRLGGVETFMCGCTLELDRAVDHAATWAPRTGTARARALAATASLVRDLRAAAAAGDWARVAAALAAFGDAIMSERRGGAIAAALAGLSAGEVEDLDEEAATLLAGARRYCGAAAKVPPPILATDRDVIVAISRIDDPAVRSRVDALWARLATAEGLLEEPRGWDAGDPPAIAAPAAVAAPAAAAPPAAAPPAPPANGKPKPVDVAGAISRIAEPEVKAKVSSLFDRLATVERLAP